MLSPDEHAREAEQLLEGVTDLRARDAGDPSDMGLLVQMATAHALLAQRPEVVTSVQETTSTDEMATFTQAQGLDDIRDWHADAAPKADAERDFDAWLHVRDVGKLLDRIDRHAEQLRRSDEGRERQRAKAGHRGKVARGLIRTVKHVAAEIGDQGGDSPLSFADRLGAACAEAERALAEGHPGLAVPSAGVTEDRLREVIAANPYLGTWDEWVDHYDKLTVQARSVMAHLHGRHDDSDLPVEFCLLCTTFRLAVPSTGGDAPNLTDAQFRALMDLVMVSDPTPLVDAADRTLTGLLDVEATSRGFDSWSVAYHEFHPSTGEDQSERPPDSERARPGMTVVHKSGSRHVLDSPKLDGAPGWWLADGGGLSDRALDSDDWQLVAYGEDRTGDCVFTGCVLSDGHSGAHLAGPEADEEALADG